MKPLHDNPNISSIFLAALTTMNMTPIRRLARWWRRPLPFYQDRREAVMVTLGAGVFIAAFCLIFQPFGLSAYPATVANFFKTAGFGGVAIVAVGFNILVLARWIKGWLKPHAWTMGKEIYWGGWNIFSAGIGNFIWGTTVLDAPVTFLAFVYIQMYTVAVGSLVGVAIIVMKQVQFMRLNALMPEDHLLKEEEAEPEQRPMLFSENGQEVLALELDELLLIVAHGAYIQVHFSGPEGPGKALLRNRIDLVDEMLMDFPSLCRCHRNYIVNLRHMTEVSGFSQGYRLSLEGWAGEIPVSPRYMQDIQAYFEMAG
ncbi:MAG: LytTR family DNA-binding domain-containing protein [Bacteroidota bacterium]